MKYCGLLLSNLDAIAFSNSPLTLTFPIAGADPGVGANLIYSLYVSHFY